MDSIADMLRRRDVPLEPEESRLLRAYVKERYMVVPQVHLSEFRITLIVPTAALAGTLRLELPEITRRCKLTKKLHISIG